MKKMYHYYFITVLLFIITFRTVHAQNTPPVIHSMSVTEEAQGEQGVIQKIVKGYAVDKEDSTLPQFSYKIITGNASLIPFKKNALLDIKDGETVTIEMTVTDTQEAFSKDTLSYSAININPQLLYINETLWYNSIDNYFKGHKAFDFQTRNENLPNVLIIGNSISVGYTTFVRKALEGKCNVYRIPTNGGDTKKCLNDFDKWMGDNNWDIIHFNFGLHDLKRIVDNKLNSEGQQVNSPKEYQNNLEKIVLLLEEKTDAKLIWATTSVVPEGAEGRIKGDEITYNKIANKIMKKHHVPIDDQYILTVNHPEDQLFQNVHFKASGVKRQGDQAAAIILKVLEEKSN